MKFEGIYVIISLASSI